MNKNTLKAQLVREKLFDNDQSKMTDAYNFMFGDNLSVDTITRYCNSGMGYENGGPTQFRNFVDVLYDLI